jgi:transcriptional regulator with XRE-family HTH domain
MEMKDKIKNLRKRLNLTQVEFAKLLDVDEQSTISKWERGDQQPGAERSAKLANLAGMTINEWLGIETGGTRDNSGARTFNVVGELEADAWRESVYWPQERHYTVPFPLPPVSTDMVLQGFIARGPSMNVFYPDGSIVFVSRVKKFKPRNGQRVMVVRRNKEGKCEATVKEYVANADGTEWLWPRSTDPHYQAPVQLKSTPDMHVDIVGVVVAVIALENWL